MIRLQASRRVGYSAEQPEGARATEPCVHDGSHRHRRGDLLSLHCPASAHERVPSTRTERAERSAEVSQLPL